MATLTADLTPMNCRQAKSELALWVGGDLTESSALELERHVAVCPSCRTLREGLSASHTALQAAAAAPVLRPAHEESTTARREANRPRPASDSSIWPAVSARITRSEQSRSQRFNGWVPAMAVSAACVAILFVAAQNATQSTRGFRSPDDSWQQPIPLTPAVGPPRISSPNTNGIDRDITFPQAVPFDRPDPRQREFQNRLRELDREFGPMELRFWDSGVTFERRR